MNLAALHGVIGIIALLLVAYYFSKDRKAIQNPALEMALI